MSVVKGHEGCGAYEVPLVIPRSFRDVAGPTKGMPGSFILSASKCMFWLLHLAAGWRIVICLASFRCEPKRSSAGRTAVITRLRLRKSISWAVDWLTKARYAPLNILLNTTHIPSLVSWANALITLPITPFAFVAVVSGVPRVQRPVAYAKPAPGVGVGAKTPAGLRLRPGVLHDRFFLPVMQRLCFSRNGD